MICTHRHMDRHTGAQLHLYSGPNAHYNHAKAKPYTTTLSRVMHRYMNGTKLPLSHSKCTPLALQLGQYIYTI